MLFAQWLCCGRLHWITHTTTQLEYRENNILHYSLHTHTHTQSQHSHWITCGIIIIIFMYSAKAVASLHHNTTMSTVDDMPLRVLQSDGWHRFVAGGATFSVDDQVGDATCGQEVS